MDKKVSKIKKNISPELPLEGLDDTSLELEKKKCNHCKIEKPLSEYRLDRGFVRHLCRECDTHKGKVRSRLHKTAESQPDYCQCCGTHKSECARKKLVLDHDPHTDLFRRWICERCNLGLGRLGDTVENLMKAIQYLKNSKGNQNDT
jgi:hypothetical protein